MMQILKSHFYNCFDCITQQYLQTVFFFFFFFFFFFRNEILCFDICLSYIVYIETILDYAYVVMIVFFVFFVFFFRCCFGVFWVFFFFSIFLYHFDSITDNRCHINNVAVISVLAQSDLGFGRRCRLKNFKLAALAAILDIETERF